MSLEQALAENTLALNALTVALKAAGVAGANVKATTEVKTTGANAAGTGEADKAPFLWANNEKGTYGEEKTAAALAKKLKADKGAARVSQNVYDQLVEADAEGNDEGSEGGDGELPTLEKVQEVFGGFLKIDDAAKREKRKAWVRTLLEQFGVEKASLLADEHRAEAINYIERVLGGEKLDPKTANKSGAESAEDDDMV